MLTKDLLLFSSRLGKLKPRFIDAADPRLLELAEALVATAQASVGESYGALEEALQALGRGAPAAKLGAGLVKLLLDRTEVAEPDETAAADRLSAQRLAATVLRGLPADCALADYQAALDQALGGQLFAVRARLYADLPARRAVAAVDCPDGSALLERYNLALAQSFLLYAKKLLLRLVAPPKLELRRVLRWLKFCRLVVEVERVGSDLLLTVEGPAALFASAKRYGLQLAMFLEVLPILPKWSLAAEIALPRRPELQLLLDQDAPLVSPLRAGLGHVPEEVEQTLAKLESDANFELDREPEPRPIGVNGLLVPDLGLKERSSGRRVVIELFHPWHRGALTRRIEGLRARPDQGLLLGVDRALAKDPVAAAILAERPEVFLFNRYPSEKILKDAVRRHLLAEG